MNKTIFSIFLLVLLVGCSTTEKYDEEFLEEAQEYSTGPEEEQGPSTPKKVRRKTKRPHVSKTKLQKLCHTNFKKFFKLSKYKASKSSQFFDFYLSLGDCHYEKDEAHQAFEYYTKAKALIKARPRMKGAVFYKLAETLILLRQYDKAKSYLLVSKDYHAVKNKSLYQIGLIELRFFNPSSALAHIGQIDQTSFPQDLLKMSRAHAYFLMGNYQKSIALYGSIDQSKLIETGSGFLFALSLFRAKKYQQTKEMLVSLEGVDFPQYDNIREYLEENLVQLLAKR
ncbi:MAG: hypothetical protein HOE90_23075 [Bacteriovoracaceae bacterium]|jgi:tetratricopeptide (TPR) repeat protein|nr:hypothetical protein [Bacteriovoracaceae bacterium]